MWEILVEVPSKETDPKAAEIEVIWDLWWRNMSFVNTMGHPLQHIISCQNSSEGIDLLQNATYKMSQYA